MVKILNSFIGFYNILCSLRYGAHYDYYVQLIWWIYIFLLLKLNKINVRAKEGIVITRIKKYSHLVLNRQITGKITKDIKNRDGAK